MTYAEGIAIADNGDIHVIGYGYYENATIMKGHWWVNGQLKQSFDNNQLTDITIYGNDVYIVGYHDSSGNSVYVNGNIIELKNAERTYACSISVHNGDVYVAGSESFRVTNKAVYWIMENGILLLMAYIHPELIPFMYAINYNMHIIYSFQQVYCPEIISVSYLFSFLEIN